MVRARPEMIPLDAPVLPVYNLLNPSGGFPKWEEANDLFGVRSQVSMEEICAASGSPEGRTPKPRKRPQISSIETDEE